MTAPPTDPVRDADAEARALACSLLASARHAALSYADTDGSPAISRIAFGLDADGMPLTLISALAAHARALRDRPSCAVMVGEPGAKGDPLTHPRLMLKAEARFVAADDSDRPWLRALWLRSHPKAKLYIDFADFAFVRLTPVSALLNGGFGRAFRLLPNDLRGAG